jgi:2-methylisocitrate lyase-like PEP mutase family enzyme
MPDVSVAQLAEAGATRLSIGGAMAVVAYGALVEGGREMENAGTFQWLSKRAPGKDIAQLLGK